MVETTKKLVSKMEECTELCMKEIFKPDSIEDLTCEGFQALQLLYAISRSSGELLIKQAETLEEMKEKLDKLSRLEVFQKVNN